MTTPMIPDYVLTLYENEIRKIVKKVLARVSTEYGHEVQELEAKVADIIYLKLVPEEFECVTITKKIGKKVVPDEDRCVARMKRNGLFIQCTRAKGTGGCLCKMHSKKLVYGTINDPPPPEATHRGRKNLH